MCIEKKKSLKKLACIAQTLAVVVEFIVDQVTHNSAATGNERRSETAFIYFLFTFSLGRHATPILVVVVFAGRVSVIAAVAAMPFRLESHYMHLNTLTEAAAETRRHTETWSTFQTDILYLFSVFHSSSLCIFACRLAAKNS